MSQGRLARAAAGMVVVSLLSKILGFGRETVIAAQLGATAAGDAFKVASFIPMMLFNIIAAALGNTFIPLLTELETSRGEKELNRYVANVTNSITVIALVFAGLGMLLNPWLVKLIAPGFKAETYQLTVELVYWLMPCIVLLGFIGLTTGYLNFRHVFARPLLGGVVFNIIIIAGLILLVPWLGVQGAVLALLLAYGGQVLYQLAVAIRYGFRFRPVLDWREPYLKRMLKLAVPVIIGTAVWTVSTLVDRIFASSLAEGSISALDYAARLNSFALGLFVSAIASVYFPTLSRAGAARDWGAFNDHLLRAININIYIILPMAVGLLVLAQPIVRLLFERGAFDSRATAMTAEALAFLSLGLLAFALREIFSRAFYSLQDTLTPLTNGIMTVLLNVGLNAILVRLMGLSGIALATSLASNLMILYLGWRLKGKAPRLSYRPVWIAAGKGVVAVLAMALAVKGCDLLLARWGSQHWGLVLRVGLDIVLGAGVYFLALWWLKVTELQELLSWAGKKLKISFLKV
ncbi:putative peptidoglycan lipid II flippase [Carboxydocella thermautotrophica]|nr:putative peptidoglycan lipid II flippase [Carboxydocella thermautotrophica]